jgi:polyhydroxyalkanoate synthase subunit PhaC
MDIVPQAQFAMIDAFRRAQGDILGAIGFGPAECSYRVPSSGPHWRLRSYGQTEGRPALLIVSAPIKKPYIWDLAPSISTVRLCLAHHWSVYLLEWRSPAAKVQVRGLADYADQPISKCVTIVTGQSGGRKPFLMGHSLGGTLAFLCLGTTERPGPCACKRATLLRAKVEPVPRRPRRSLAARVCC